MKKFLAILIFTTAMGLAVQSSAAIATVVELKTPRGRLIKLDVYNPGSAKAVVLAPGESCNPRSNLYQPLADEAGRNGFSLIRVYWAYCVSDPENGHPSEDLSTEKEDLTTGLKYANEILGLKDGDITLGGKSLGSIVSYEVFSARPSLAKLLLLTPVCTDRTDANNHKSIFADYYPKLSAELRTVLLVQGNADPICETKHFQEYLAGKPNNFILLVTKGDHSLGIKNPDGQDIPELSVKNLLGISKWIFSWL